MRCRGCGCVPACVGVHRGVGNSWVLGAWAALACWAYGLYWGLGAGHMSGSWSLAMGGIGCGALGIWAPRHLAFSRAAKPQHVGLSLANIGHKMRAVQRARFVHTRPHAHTRPHIRMHNYAHAHA